MVLKGLAAAVATLALSLPVALAADPVRIAPGQRVELKVLLLSADGNEPGYGAWRAALDREGIPYDAIIASQAGPLSDATFADYDADHARYQAVITASGDLGQPVTNPGGTVSFLSALSDAEWAALAKFERTFGIRRLSDATAATPAHGLVLAGGASQDGQPGQLTAEGRAAFPYLKGPVTIADDSPDPNEAFGYPAIPVDPAKWTTLLGVTGGAYLGIYTPGDGREEMVMTVASNQFQNHNQLLRHGMLNWVTRGVFLGFQRAYLELHVDDLFLADDAWDEASNTTSYDPARASRMSPADVDRAIAWSRARGLRIDMAYNAGGSAPGDPLTQKFADPAVRGAFGYVNHTLDHPNLDCSSASFIARQIRENVTRGEQLGLALDRSELVTGEHSGLANARPGNPGTIDPPSIDLAEPVAGGGAVPAGSYDYALTARSPAGETVPSVVTNVALAAPGAVTISFDAICHAVGFELYRRPAGTTAWAKVLSVPRDATAPTDDGTQPIVLTATDTAAAGVAAEPPAANGAALAPYPQNPGLAAALEQTGVRTVASDASKGYPSTPTVITSPLLPAGAPFTQGAVRGVPRYPSNVYYNVSRQGQQLDEYNWIYVSPANGGGCVAIPNVTTCRTAPATWAEYVALETRVMFRHLMDNDPRPHYFHQSNLADYDPGRPETDLLQGGILYPVIGALVDRYEASFDRARSPLVQLTQSGVSAVLARHEAWLQARGAVSAWVQDGRVYVRNSGMTPVEVPLTGTTAGELYGGQRSGWISLAPGAQADYAPADPAAAKVPAISGRARVGETVTASTGEWAGTPGIEFRRQWQRCEARCVNIAGATGASYEPVAEDVGRRLRVAVSAGNWISSVSQALSEQTGEVERAPDPPRRGDDRPRGADDRRVGLRLTQVRVSPRRFAVAHRRLPRGTRLDGTRISWRLNRAATVRLTFQRRVKSGWRRVGRIERSAKAGAGVVRFRGRFGKKLLRPQRYRVVVVATGGGERTPARRIGFRVVKG